MYRAFFKRLLDICGAIFLIVLTLPIMAVVAVLIYFKVSRDVIFTQARPGLHAKIFKIYGGKLNLTPINNAEAIAVHGDKFEILGR